MASASTALCASTASTMYRSAKDRTSVQDNDIEGCWASTGPTLTYRLRSGRVYIRQSDESSSFQALIEAPPPDSRTGTSFSRRKLQADRKAELPLKRGVT